jgi:hypothetical protein
MTSIVVGKELQEKLKDLVHAVVFCDESGHTVGRFVPEPVYVRMTTALAKIEFTEEEFERAERQPGGRTTEQVLERLKSL